MSIHSKRWRIRLLAQRLHKLRSPRPLKRLSSKPRGSRSSELENEKELGQESFSPAAKFLEPLGIDFRLIKKVINEGFHTLTKIQLQAIPKCLGDKDIFIRHQTGSGKTLAYLIPALQILLNTHEKQPLRREDGTRVLLIAPTRELVNQTIHLAQKLTTPFPYIVVGLITGGLKRKSEKMQLKKGVTFLGATVGRLSDHIQQTASFNLTNLQMIILDEADRLLDMGFEKKLRWLIPEMRAKKFPGEASSTQGSTDIQSFLISATLTPQVISMADFVLRPGESEWVTSDQHKPDQDPLMEFPLSLTHYYVPITLRSRIVLLISVLLQEALTGKVIVFFSSCSCVEYHHRLLSEAQWPSLQKNNARAVSNPPLVFKGRRYNAMETEAFVNETVFEQKHNDNCIFAKYALFKLHGSMTQLDRAEYLRDFNTRSSHAILFTTDVAARGLNLNGASYIVQVDPPQEVSEYVHRVGRTARCGGQGKALLFLNDHELGYADYLISKGVPDLQRVSEVQLLQPLVQNFLPATLKAQRLRNVDKFIYNSLVAQVDGDPTLLAMAKGAYQSSVAAYRCYAKQIREYFQSKQLHLGHFASAFCLSMSPSQVFKGRGNNVAHKTGHP